MIEMVAEFIAAILGLIKKGQLEQASQTLDHAYLDFLKTDASLFREIPKEGLTETLLRDHNYTNGHLKILSELFFAEAELQLAQENNEDSLAYYEKSLILFKFVEKESKSFSFDKQSRLSFIEERISHLKNAASWQGANSV